MHGLSLRQKELLAHLRDYRRRMQYCPSYQELAETMGRDRSSVRQIVDALVRKGYVTHRPRIPRSLRILKRWDV